MPNNIYSAIKRVSRRVAGAADNSLRAALMVFVLQPAADFLSKERALSVARACGSLMLRVPSSGNPARSTMEKAFRMKGHAAMESAREYLAQPFYAFVVFRRLLRGREQATSWKIEEENSEEVCRLRESGQPFIVASGHFARHAFLSLYQPRITTGPLQASLGPLPDFKWKPSTILVRVQFGQLLRGLRLVRPDAEFMFAGGNGSGRKPSDAPLGRYLDHFKLPGATAIISADAFWSGKGGSVVRPFTGHLSHTFATGAARLGRLVQCPVIPCAPHLRSDGTIVLKWGAMIPPPPQASKDMDVQNTNAILDFLETEVGLRPTQYVLYIGDSRCWDPALKRWVDPIDTSISEIKA